MRAKKSLGQNFLMHQQTAERIADAAGITKNDTVFEIGPGTGMLTRALLARAKKVIAIEADADLLPVLRETFAVEIQRGALTLIAGDIRTFDRTTLPVPYTVVANIPYYLTGDIIRTFLSHTHPPASITFLVQKEVAERIARSKKESILSVAVKTFGEPKYQFTVPRGAFIPAPNVDSAVISIQNIHSPFISEHEEKAFFSAIHAAFAHKRKLLVKNLETLYTPESIHRAFSNLSLPEKVRAEDVPANTWQKLTKNLHTNAH